MNQLNQSIKILIEDIERHHNPLRKTAMTSLYHTNESGEADGEVLNFCSSACCESAQESLELSGTWKQDDSDCVIPGEHCCGHNCGVELVEQ